MDATEFLTRLESTVQKKDQEITTAKRKKDSISLRVQNQAQLDMIGEEFVAIRDALRTANNNGSDPVVDKEAGIKLAATSTATKVDDDKSFLQLSAAFVMRVYASPTFRNRWTQIVLGLLAIAAALVLASFLVMHFSPAAMTAALPLVAHALTGLSAAAFNAMIGVSAGALAVFTGLLVTSLFARRDYNTPTKKAAGASTNETMVGRIWASVFSGKKDAVSAATNVADNAKEQLHSTIVPAQV